MQQPSTTAHSTLALITLMTSLLSSPTERKKTQQKGEESQCSNTHAHTGDSHDLHLWLSIPAGGSRVRLTACNTAN